MKRNNIFVAISSMLIVAVIAGGLLAQRGPGRAQGKGGPGFRGGRQDPTFETDHKVFHFLLANGDKIRRHVKNLDNGIETLTESDDPEITAKIQEHVAAMYDRLKERRPIHMRDPLFRELFQHTDKIELNSKATEKGIRVVETSKDPHVARLLQAHAKVVTLFIKNGHDEAHKNHAVPARDGKVAAVGEKEQAAAAACCKQKKVGCQGGKCKAASAQTKLEGKACCQATAKKVGCPGGKCKAEAAQPKTP